MADHPPPRAPRRAGMLPPVGARTPGLDELGDDGDGDDWDDDWQEPNYLVRRALAVGAGLVVIAVLVFAVTQLLGGDDDDGAADAASADWNTAVVLTADEIRLVDPSNGDVVETFDSQLDLLDAQTAVAGDVLVAMSDAGRIVLTDLRDGTTTRGRAGLDESVRLSPDNPSIGIVGADGGGDVTLIDTVERDVISVETVAGLSDPLIFAVDVLVNPAGTHAAMAEARTFQSIVVDIAEQTAEPLAGQVVAIGDDRVVTAQRAGDSTELEFYDLAGERLGSVDVPTPVAAMLTRGGEMLVVDSTGTIRLAGADGEVSDVAALADPDDAAATFEVVRGAAAHGGTRLLVATNSAAFVLDASGEQLAMVPGDFTSTPSRSKRCVTAGSARSTGSSVLLDLDDGSTIATIPGGIPVATSVDGCTVALIGPSGPQLITDGELVDVDADSVIDIAPDGAAYVVRDGRDSELVEIGSDDQVELTDEASVIRFAQR